jgi:exopolysaccharide biosynthesis WecB/TagA/CpsF family protein
MFLGHRFHVGAQAEWRDRFLAPKTDSFSYVVTPNVDHLVQISKHPEIIPVYEQADWHVCDSRVLGKLARGRGLDLKPYPGADLVRDLLNDPRSLALPISVVGPSHEDFRTLATRFPGHDFRYIEAPIMQRGDAEWDKVLGEIEKSGAVLHLLCLSFPKQEFFAHDLRSRGIVRGLGLCVGASVDFLTERQKRAPLWMRKAGLEWAYRLITEPRRLWKRYLVDGPRIFAMYLREKA